jgi:hypothetical protein
MFKFHGNFITRRLMMLTLVDQITILEISLIEAKNRPSDEKESACIGQS